MLSIYVQLWSIMIICFLKIDEHLQRSTGNLEKTVHPHALSSHMYIDHKALLKKKHARCILLFMDFLQRLLNFEVGKLDEIGPIWTKFPNEVVTEVPLPSEKSWASQLSYHQAPWSHQCCQDQFTLFLTSFVYLTVCELRKSTCCRCLYRILYKQGLP